MKGPMAKKHRSGWVYAGFLFFLLLLILGINMGETRAILEKATKICLSCVGLG